MKILVTGSKGFVGSHLINELSKKHEIYGYDLKDGFDVKNYNQLDSFLGLFKCDVIVHLAALIHQDESFERPYEYFSTNLLGTLNVLECARKYKIKKVIFTSSAGAIYPDSPYGLSKLVGEQLCNMYSKYGIKTYSLRIFNIYGEGNEKGVIYEFMKRIENNESIIVYGNGKNIRDYIHIDDVVSTIVSFIEKDLKPGLYEVGTGVGTRVNDLIKCFSEITGKKIKVKRKPARDEIACSIAKNSIAENCIKLKDGIGHQYNELGEWTVTWVT